MELRVKALIYIGICLATFIAYEPVRHNDFVSYDDTKYITENPDVKAPITFQSLGRAFTQPHSHMWHPLTTITNMLDYELFGLNPVGHHFINLLLHIANTMLLFWILTDMTGAIWPSAFVAAVFALHPLQVESVAWAAELKTVLSGLFWLLATAAYIHYTRKSSAGRYILLLLVFGLCILTKPTVVTLPLALLLLDYWPLGRIKFGQQTKNVRKGKNRQEVSIRRLIIEKIPLLAMSVFLSIVTFFVQQSGGALSPLEKMSLDLRIANIFLSYIRYIGKTVWPSRLAVLYPHPYTNLSETIVVFCALLFILLSVFSIYIGRRRRYIAVGWLWYVGTLVPMIGLVQSGAQAMANRYMYIPVLGLLIIITWTVKDFVAKRPRWKIVPAVLAAVILLSLVILTRMQVRHWQNSITLFEYALKTTKNNAVMENNYGYVLFKAGRDREAVLHLSNAVKINPTYADARDNLGAVFLKQGKFNEAIWCFNELLKNKQDSAEVYVNLGIAYNKLGKYRPAIQNWTRAVEIEPNSTGVLNNLAWLLATTSGNSVQDANKAIEFAQHACELTGYKDINILDTLAAAYAAAGRFNDAITTAQQAVNIAKASGQENLISEIQNRIELYKTGRRYIQK
ncbi:MAG: tetratricopeptide repeat protein [Sedimentisphaerales bacterium]